MNQSFNQKEMSGKRKSRVIAVSGYFHVLERLVQNSKARTRRPYERMYTRKVNWGAHAKRCFDVCPRPGAFKEATQTISVASWTLQKGGARFSCSGLDLPSSLSLTRAYAFCPGLRCHPGLSSLLQKWDHLWLRNGNSCRVYKGEIRQALKSDQALGPQEVGALEREWRKRECFEERGSCRDSLMKLPILQNSAYFGEQQEEKCGDVYQRLPKHYVREQPSGEILNYGETLPSDSRFL